MSRGISPIFLILLKGLSLVVFFVTILASYGGHVNPEHFATPSLLCLFTPYLATLTILIVIAWIFAKNIIFAILGVITILVCIPSMSETLPLGYAREGDEKSYKFKIISWNVLHADDIRKPDYPGNRALEYMINSEADIICLTELYNFSTKEIKNLPPTLLDSLNKAYPYKAGLNSSDITVIAKFPVERIKYSLFDDDGRHRFDFFKVSFPDYRQLIVGMVHLDSYGLSNEERNVVTEIKSVKTAERSVKEFKGTIMEKMKDAFRKRARNAEILRDAIDEIPKEMPLIVCGDFNDVPSSWAYNIVRGEDMHDAYAETNFGPAFTYNLHKFYFHIDHMLYRGDIKALDLKVGKINTSDHYPLIGEFEFTNP